MGLPLQSRARVAASCVVMALLAATGSAPAAARKPIRGELSKRGYTVVAVAADGRAKAVLASRGRFTVLPPASRVTLHLRAPNGKYAGPIVVGRRNKGRRAIVGLNAGARLRSVRVRRGYANVARVLPKKWVDATRWARARRGVPIGVGVFGRVRSRPPGSFDEPLRPEDRDVDGVPNVLDIDDDGDLVLDNFDRRPLCYRCPGGRRAGSVSGRAAQDPEQDPEVTDKFRVTSFLELGIEQTVNANAPGPDPGGDTAPLPSFGHLTLGLSDRPLPAGAELDCAQPQEPTGGRFDPSVGGLLYCSTGGTGRVFQPGVPPSLYPEFPECCDPGPGETEADGFGTVTADPGGCSPAIQGCHPFMTLLHGASADKIGTGDYLLLKASDHDRSAVLQAAFATPPTLRTYDDDGPGGKAPVPVTYPVAPPTPGPGGLGTRGNGIPVSAPAGEDVKVTLTFWRPQRRPIGVGKNKEACLKDKPPCQWVDVGGLIHRAVPQGEPGAGPFDECPQATYEDHLPALTVPGGDRSPGLVDEAPNRPADPDNFFTYTLNLTECLRSRGLSFNQTDPPEERAFSFGARPLNSRDIATQTVYFKRQ